MYLVLLLSFSTSLRATCLAPHLNLKENNPTTQNTNEVVLQEWTQKVWNCADFNLLWQSLFQFSQSWRDFTSDQKNVLLQKISRPFWLQLLLLSPNQIQHDLLLLAYDDLIYLPQVSGEDLKKKMSADYFFEEYKNRAIVSLFERQLNRLEPTHKNIDLIYGWLAENDDVWQRDLLFLEYFETHKAKFVISLELTEHLWRLLKTPFAHNRILPFLPSKFELKLRTQDIIYLASQQDQDLKKFDWLSQFMTKNKTKILPEVAIQLEDYLKGLDLRIDMVRKKASLESLQKFNKQGR